MKSLHAKLIGLAAVASALAVTTAALADGMPQRRAPAARAPVEAPFSWTGFYGGVNLGIQWVDTGATTATAADADTAAALVNACNGGICVLNYPGDTSTGVIGGLQVGYNMQMHGGFLLGFETDIQGSTAGTSSGASSTNVAGCCGLAGVPWNGATTTNVEWIGTVRARLGALVSPTLLAYITGGFAYAQVERTYGGTFITSTGAAVGNSAYLGRTRDIDTGWTFGGGMEWAITNRVTLGAEYLYVALDGGGTYRSSATLPFGGICNSSNCNLLVRADDVDSHIARLKLNYKF